MAYSIHVSVVQLCGTYDVVEETAWDNTYWTRHGGTFVLHLHNSGSSGTLRFQSLNNEKCNTFIVAVGVHNNKRWCDIVTDLPPRHIGAKFNSLYYGEHPDSTGREEMLWKQLSEVKKTTRDGRNISLVYTTAVGNDLYATLTIH